MRFRKHKEEGYRLAGWLAEDDWVRGLYDRLERGAAAQAFLAAGHGGIVRMPVGLA